MMSIDASHQRQPLDDSICIQRPDIFSRGALDLTFRLLRKNNPSLALEVRNILAGETVPLEDAAHYSPQGDHFFITMPAQRIGCVVKALTQLGQDALDDGRSDTGKLVVLRTLIKEWMTLAEWIILTAEEESPPLH
ncbi:hypothetical protein R50073_31710 [Maricurvus nonylphenolicus]|uniref:hypothetical protein n=1 Tax=Maricurvus nonylphenolicus TaxID=1008307 RepID=UPI0036F2F2B2